MQKGVVKIALKSIKFYRKQAVFQFLIILLLGAVITGSLMTGRSVRKSLERTALEKTGNTGIFISSGLRYFSSDLQDRFRKETGFNSTGILELRGSAQGFASQRISGNVSLYAVTDDFFRFNGIDQKIDEGTVIINNKIAASLGIKEGEEIIVKFPGISDIPADAPFAPSNDETISMVLKIGKIADAKAMGNFSLSISQVTTPNLFLNLSDLEKFLGRKLKINRLLIERNAASADEVHDLLKNTLAPEYAGLHIRKTKNNDNYEIISDRVFLDEILVAEIKSKISSSYPVLTYLANRIEHGTQVNPYSFVSTLPPEMHADMLPDGMIINKWLAEDINAAEGDSVLMSWYSPDSLNHLIEKSQLFRIAEITEFEGLWADSTLMPEFPGISGSESCSQWDAGIPVKTNLIRQKDEDYWDRYKGTPKAFIKYEKGEEIWGSNYGPATAIRFSEILPYDTVYRRLAGSLDPSILGFTVSDIYSESIQAATESVDFGTLFLSLGFFLILAAFVLLSFAVSWYFDLKKNEIRVQYSLGFRNRLISALLLSETMIIALAGAIAGAIMGYLVNIILIGALNSVWTGAVQTNTLVPAFDPISILTGFFATFLTVTFFMFLKTRNYLKKLMTMGTKHYAAPSSLKNLIMLISSAVITVSFLIASLLSDGRITLSFIAGTVMLVSLILFWRQYFLNGRKRKSGLAGSYYSFYPSHAIAPVLFIAAGIFAVVITAVNRKDFNKQVNDNSSGTGGYTLWMETSIPVPDDLNERRGRSNLGLDGEELSGVRFIQMKKSPGNDASCLNLNHITAPPLLGADPGEFVSHRAFSFVKTIRHQETENPWMLLENEAGPNTIYGFADQTVLDWGLKIGVGDTLVLRAESGQPLKIIIAGGLQSSVFQGNVIISNKNFTKYYPSVSGYTAFLADGPADSTAYYKNTLIERLSAWGVIIESTADRLASFYEITNTYLSVFGVFGALGMITGVAGLGFVLLRNYNRRKKEFALMLSTGFTLKKIRRMIFSEQLLILAAGLMSGLLPAVIATMPSLRGNHEIPWIYLLTIIIAIFLTGAMAVLLSVRSIQEKNLMTAIRRE